MAKKQFEKTRTSFVYNAQEYEGEIVCSHIDPNTYWFVFKEPAPHPFEVSVEFRMAGGRVEPAQQLPGYEAFIDCITAVVQQHLQDLCR